MVAVTLPDGYRVEPRPRWGWGLPPHPQVQAALEKGRAGYEKVLDDLAAQRTHLHRIKYEPEPHKPRSPHWHNYWFTALDAASLVGFLLARKPKRYVEIGSGHSTMFARYAVKRGMLPTNITSIDPNPRADIDQLCHRIVRTPLEKTDLGLFDTLEAGDVLFYDGSHRVFTNSDVSVFFLELLPRLKPGVLVHVHDIFLPSDYPAFWNASLYSEQYLLAAMLLCGAPPFRVVLPNFFVCMDPALGARVREIFKAPDGGRDIPFAYPDAMQMPGVPAGNSFWFETVVANAPA